MNTTNLKLFPELEETIRNLDISEIPEERKKILQPFIDFLQHKVDHKENIRLNFICTHNSRRSHLSQVWAQVMAAYFGINKLNCFSGGTEATALFPMAAKTMEKAGFNIDKISEGKNPVYSIKFGPDELPVIGFSKKYDHPFNPESGFGAIMTCSQADADCPFIPGAAKRIPLNYEDPKKFDGTSQQEEKYRERSLQIATELYYVFSKIK